MSTRGNKMQKFSESEKHTVSIVKQSQNGMQSSSATKLAETKSLYYDGRHYDLYFIL